MGTNLSRFCGDELAPIECINYNKHSLSHKQDNGIENDKMQIFYCIHNSSLTMDNLISMTIDMVNSFCYI